MKPGEQLPAGQMLDGRYRVHKVLGQGGMGRVYLANDTRLANRPVAAKEMIIGDGIAEKKAIEDFAREARVLAALSHPGIPNVIDYFAENNRHYLVMEFVAGGDLQGMLDKLGPKGKLPEARVLRWARQMLDVLSFLHGQTPPIIYRDLKPGNIMIDKDGRAMLIDFGIARFLPPGGRGTQIGSVGYAPPEQYMGKVEPRSDLYSLAATIHHLLTGRDPQLEPPFSFPPLRDLSPEVSVKTAEVVMRALDKDVEKRPASAREMMHALPDPGPEPKASGALGSSAGNAAPIASMRTVVLDRPQSIGSPGIGVQMPPASGKRLGAAPSADPGNPSAKPSLTNMPTVVLAGSGSSGIATPVEPISLAGSRGPVSAAPPAPSRFATPPTLASSTAAGVAKVKSLARSARAMAQRAAAKIEAQQSLFGQAGGTFVTLFHREDPGLDRQSQGDSTGGAARRTVEERVNLEKRARSECSLGNKYSLVASGACGQAACVFEHILLERVCFQPFFRAAARKQQKGRPKRRRADGPGCASQCRRMAGRERQCAAFRADPGTHHRRTHDRRSRDRRRRARYRSRTTQGYRRSCVAPAR